MKQYPLSIWSNYFWEPFETVIEELISAGIGAAELSTEHGEELFRRSEQVEETGAAVRAFLAERNFIMTQGHLPIAFKIVAQRDQLSTLLRYIDLYEACGVKNMVLHCDISRNLPDIPFENMFDENVKSLKVIAEHIKGRDICICLENLHTSYPNGLCDYADKILKIIDAVGSDRFGICLDTGHLNLSQGDQVEFIRTAGKYLRALHIADNRGIKDDHLAPYNGGNIDFVRVLRALYEVGYDGLFNLEIPGETCIPVAIPNHLRFAKIEYIKTGYDYLQAAAQAE